MRGLYPPGVDEPQIYARKVFDIAGPQTLISLENKVI